MEYVIINLFVLIPLALIADNVASYFRQAIREMYSKIMSGIALPIP